MYRLILFLLLLSMMLVALSTCDNNDASESIDMITGVMTVMEYAYFEGQRDALNGEIKIQMPLIDSTWTWIESPWDNNPERVITFLPTEYYDFRQASDEQIYKMLGEGSK